LKNAFRHSFGTYRQAVLKNIAQVSDEMGNSIGICKCNYAKPISPEIAQEWFSILPE